MKVCCIIKPEAVGIEADIIRVLIERGISVCMLRPITYTRSLIDELYDHMPEDARNAIADMLVGKEGIALLLEVASLSILLDIMGRESDPARCAPDSIRGLYGLRAGPVQVGSWPWWENAIHRPVDQREAERDLSRIFGCTNTKSGG